MIVLTREALLSAAAATNLPRERVETPELGEGTCVWVQGMTGAQRDRWEKSLMRGRGAKRTVDTENVRAKLAVQCLVDENGKRLLQDHESAALGNLRVDVLQRIFGVCQRLSGVSDEDADELEKSSGPVDGSGSPTN